VTKFCEVVAHDLLLQKITPGLFMGLVSPPQKSHHHGIYVSILLNPSDLSPQLEHCSVTIAVMLLTTDTDD
jgi:hypothetical protein